MFFDCSQLSSRAISQYTFGDAHHHDSPIALCFGCPLAQRLHGPVFRKPINSFVASFSSPNSVQTWRLSHRCFPYQISRSKQTGIVSKSKSTRSIISSTTSFWSIEKRLCVKKSFTSKNSRGIYRQVSCKVAHSSSLVSLFCFSARDTKIDVHCSCDVVGSSKVQWASSCRALPTKFSYEYWKKTWVSIIHVLPIRNGVQESMNFSSRKE